MESESAVSGTVSISRRYIYIRRTKKYVLVVFNTEIRTFEVETRQLYSIIIRTQKVTVFMICNLFTYPVHTYIL